MSAGTCATCGSSIVMSTFIGAATPRMAERRGAKEYLEKYSVMDLFDFIQAQIVYNQPENPSKFAAALLKQVKAGDFAFYSPEEVDILFRKFEVLDRGYITDLQCRNALRDIGVRDQIIAQFPVDKEVKIDKFRELVAQCFDARLRGWRGE